MPRLNPDVETRQSLLIRLRDGHDESAWQEFTEIYEPVIYASVRRRGFQDADAREVVQEVLLAVASSIERFDSSRGRFRGWLSRVTRNATIDKLRHIASRREVSGGSDLWRSLDVGTGDRTDFAEEFERERRVQLFRWAAAQVRRRSGEVNWLAFWRTAVEGQAIATVANDLGIRNGAVHVARCRILKRIRDLVHQRLAE